MMVRMKVVLKAVESDIESGNATVEQMALRKVSSRVEMWV